MPSHGAGGEQQGKQECLEYKTIDIRRPETFLENAFSLKLLSSH